MRKSSIIAATALTAAGLAVSAGAANASASPVIDDNEHANTGDGVNVVVSDLLTNSLNDVVKVGDVAKNVSVLDGSVVDVL